MTIIEKLLFWAGLAALFIAGVFVYTAKVHRDGFKEAEAKYLPRAQKAEKAYESSETLRKDYERQVTDLTGIARAARSELAVVRDANAELARSGERLRQQLSVARRKACAASAAASGSGAADTSDDLPAVVQQRLDEAADGIARFADESRVAGLACQRAYEVKP